MREIKTINVIGLGYVGLPAALQFCNYGYQVFGTDTNKELITNLKKGVLETTEAGMQKELHKALNNQIYFSQNYYKADMYVIAVPTHFDRTTKKIDPCYLISAVNSIIEVCEEDAVIVVESTVSPGTIKLYLEPLLKGKQLKIAHAPERILPGSTLYELRNNDRVIGADEVAVREQVKTVYQSFCSGKIRTTDIATAEMSKVIENTFRDVNIAFANELKKICDRMGIDVYEVISLANCHSRVDILKPGAGVGGHCISVDPWFLVGDFPELTQLISKARLVNDSMPRYVWEKLLKQITTKKIGIYGLTYKANVDDTRESPAWQLYRGMSKDEKQRTVFYDPYVQEKIYEEQVTEFADFLNKVEIILVMAPHDHLNQQIEIVKERGIRIYDPYNTISSGIKI